VDVDRKVGAMETANAHVNDARFEPPAIVRGDRDPRERDVSQARLTEADG
jgi:hypothetical protein